MDDMFGGASPEPAPPAARRARAPRAKAVPADAIDRGARISPCGIYRYTLWRRWGPGRAAMFVGLNPSTADAQQDDPTIRRCIEFARSWGYDALVMTNLFAWRATEPNDMLAAVDPVGPDNDAALRAAAGDAAVVVAAWGVLGPHLGRDAVVRAMLPRLHYLRLTKEGHPGHPLYLPAELRPVEWPAGLAGPAQDCRPAAERQTVQAEHRAEKLQELRNCSKSQVRVEPPPGAPPAPRGRLVMLHDGRQVDSWSMDWALECLASTLLRLSPGDRGEWFAGYAGIHGQQAEQDLRRLVRSVAAAREGDVPRRR